MVPSYHSIRLHIVGDERGVYSFKAFDGAKLVASGTGYMNDVLAEKAAIRELTYVFGNRYTVTYR